jgi:hypothetical protein
MQGLHELNQLDSLRDSSFQGLAQDLVVLVLERGMIRWHQADEEAHIVLSWSSIVLVASLSRV